MLSRGMVNRESYRVDCLHSTVRYSPSHSSRLCGWMFFVLICAMASCQTYPIAIARIYMNNICQLSAK